MKLSPFRTPSIAVGCSSLAFAAVFAFTACSDSSAPSFSAPTFDSGSFDPATFDSSFEFDASTESDGGTPDSGIPIVISVSNSNVTSEGIVTLTAVISGDVPLSVTFTEGAAALGTDTTAPFTQDVAYSFLENGTHTYVATAKLAGGGTITSSPINVTVNAAPNGYFVNPVSGLDTNAGTQAAPFLSIKKAVDTLTLTGATGKSIYLADGTYAGANNGFGHVLAQPTLVRGLTKSGATIKASVGAAPVTAFEFTNGGAVRDVAFEDFGTGVLVDNGDFAAAGLRFTKVTTAFSFLGAAKAFLDETGMTGFWTSSVVGNFCGISVDGSAEVTLSGGTLDGASIGHEGVWVKGSGKLSVVGTTVKNLADHVFAVSDNGKLALTDVVIQNSGRNVASNPVTDNAVIVAGLRGAAVPPLSETITLTNTEISGSNSVAIGLDHSVVSALAFNFSNSHIDANGASALFAAGAAAAGTSLTLTSTNTTFNGNRGAGIFVNEPATLSFSGGEVSSNGSNGLLFITSAAGSLKVRGTTFVKNAEDALSVSGAATTTVDLGKTGDLGNVVFTNVGAGSSAVRLEGAFKGYAVGNTWTPSVQGANASGKYVTPTTLFSGASDTNASLDFGATLVVAE